MQGYNVPSTKEPRLGQLATKHCAPGDSRRDRVRNRLAKETAEQCPRDVLRLDNGPIAALIILSLPSCAAHERPMTNHAPIPTAVANKIEAKMIRRLVNRDCPSRCSMISSLIALGMMKSFFMPRLGAQPVGVPGASHCEPFAWLPLPVSWKSMSLLWRPMFQNTVSPTPRVQCISDRSSKESSW